jgi:hypothetical protein
VYEHVLLHVKPERDQNNRATYRDNWWIFGEPRRELRPALHNLPRYIATVETAKHRVFTFVPADVLPDNMLIAIGSDNAFTLGVLQSRTHQAWFLGACGWLGVGNDPRYNETQVFDPFPFPATTTAQRAKIAAIAEELDAHRKARLAAHGHLTLTALYNTLALLRTGVPLGPAERDTHDAGQVSILRTLHDRLDAAVAAAYGWSADLPDAEIVSRIVALNAERVAEEAAGTVRWLRPEFQARDEARRRAATAAAQTEMPITITTPAPRRRRLAEGRARAVHRASRRPFQRPDLGQGDRPPLPQRPARPEARGDAGNPRRPRPSPLPGRRPLHSLIRRNGEACLRGRIIGEGAVRSVRLPLDNAQVGEHGRLRPRRPCSRSRACRAGCGSAPRAPPYVSPLHLAAESSLYPKRRPVYRNKCLFFETRSSPFRDTPPVRRRTPQSRHLSEPRRIARPETPFVRTAPRRAGRQEPPLVRTAPPRPA